jgi:1,4-dihydroxy-2-naphthoyl-CoA hydrolase
MSSPPAQLSIPGFDQLYGLELLELDHERAVGRVAVREELKQPPGAVHGGVYAATAESLASIATGRAVASDGKVALGLANQTSFLGSVTGGAIHAVARVKHRGRTTWVWEVEISDDRGALCALTRVTLAIRSRPDG